MLAVHSSNMSVTYENMISEKGKPLIVFDGYKFRRHKQLSDSSYRWSCTFKQCKSFLRINQHGVIILSSSKLNHNDHEKDPNLNRKQLSHVRKRKATEDISTPPSKLKFSEIRRSPNRHSFEEKKLKMERIIVHVEVCQKADSTLLPGEIEDHVKDELEKKKQLSIRTEIELTKFSNPIIKDHVLSVICSCKNEQEKDEIKIDEKCLLVFFVYQLNQEEAATETMQSDSDDLPVASRWILPSHDFYGLWENLCYSTNLKENLLNYIETTMQFSDNQVDRNIISWNKVILLHGPPGTGKTSLCKALAQKAAIRYRTHFTRTELVEINSHSLFSKWFSESGKLVMKLFTGIKELLEDPNALVCILIDEVESLAHARKSCTNGTEPSDSIRVVNALLTQLDQIKRYRNVLILTTSNMTEAIDLAFVDRADIKQFIGYPEEKAIRLIYKSCLEELIRKGILLENIKDDKDMKKLVDESFGLSGRALRRIPFLAHALFFVNEGPGDCNCFIKAMIKAVEDYKQNRFENEN